MPERMEFQVGITIDDAQVIAAMNQIQARFRALEQQAQQRGRGAPTGAALGAELGRLQADIDRQRQLVSRGVRQGTVGATTAQQFRQAFPTAQTGREEQAIRQALQGRRINEEKFTESVNTARAQRTAEYRAAQEAAAAETAAAKQSAAAEQQRAKEVQAQAAQEERQRRTDQVSAEQQEAQQARIRAQTARAFAAREAETSASSRRRDAETRQAFDVRDTTAEKERNASQAQADRQVQADKLRLDREALAAKRQLVVNDQRASKLSKQQAEAADKAARAQRGFQGLPSGVDPFVLQQEVGEKLANYRDTIARRLLFEQQLAATGATDVQVAGEGQALRRIRTTQERLVMERQLSADQQFIEATAALANIRGARAAREKLAELQGAGFETQSAAGLFRTPTDDPEEIDRRRAQGVLDREQLEIQSAAGQRARAAREQVGVNNAILANQNGELDAIVQERVTRERLNRVLREQVGSAERAAYEQSVAAGGPRGTLTQRVQASISARGGGAFRPPTDFQNLRQLVSGAFLTTGRFAVSSVAIYGLFQGVRNVVEEATNLQKQFSLIESQLDSMGRGSEFGQIRNDILGLARDTGTAASEVAFLELQLQGAFGNRGNDFVQNQARAGIEIRKVTGLSEEETTDSLTAISQNFDTSFRHIGDVAQELQGRFGVLSKEIITFAADLAPVAKEAGATFEQLAALGAAAQQFAGRSGSALAEAIGRVLPQVQEVAAEIYGTFRENGQADIGNLIAKQIGKGDTFAAFRTIIENIDKLGASARKTLTDTLGQRRESQTLSALFNQSTAIRQIFAEIDKEGEQFGAGRLARDFASLQETVGQVFSRLKEAAIQLGVALFQSGIDDFLTDIANTVSALIGPFSQLVKLFGSLAGFKLPGGGGSLGAVLAETLLITKLLGVFRGGGGGIGAGAPRAGGGGGFLGGLLSLATFGLLPRGGARGAATTPGLSPAQQLATAPGAFGGTTTQTAVRAGEARLATRVRTFFTSVSAPLVGVEGGAIARGRALLNGALGSFFTAIGAAIAIYAVQLTLNKKNEIDSQREALLATVQERASTPRGAEQVLLQGQRLKRELGTGFQGPFGKDPGSSIEDAAQRTLAPHYAFGITGAAAAMDSGIQAAVLNALNLSTSELRQLGLDTLGKEIATPPAANPAAIEQLARSQIKEIVSQGDPEKVNAFIDKKITELAAAAGGDNPDNKKFQRLRTIFQALLADPLTRPAVKAALDKHNQELRNLATQTDVESGQTATDQAADKQLFESGIISFTEFINRSKRRLDDVNALIAAGVRNQAILAQQAALMSDISKESAQRLRAQVDTAITAIDLTTADSDAGVEQSIALLTGLLNNPDFNDPTAVLDTVNDIYGLYQKILEERMSHAKTFAEKAAIGRTGINIPPAVQFAQTRALIVTLNEDFITVAQKASEFMGVTFDNFATQVAFIVAATGASTKEAILILVARKITIARAKADLLSKMGLDVTAAEAEIANLEKIYTDVLNSPNLDYTPPKVGKVTADPGKETGKSAEDIAKEIALARIEIFKAMTERDPLAQAQAALQEADVAARFAKDEAERLQAVAARIRAQRQLQDAIFDIANSYKELGIAIAEAAGNTVEVAQIQLQLAQDKLAQAIAGGAGTAELNRLRGDIVRAEAGVRDAQLQEQLDTIEFNLEFDKISRQQAIAQLETLLAAGNLTEQQRRDILRRIKNLQDTAGGDLQFNIPDIVLPTLYEVRRLGQEGPGGMALGGGGAGQYIDNKQVNINVFAQTNATPDQIANAVANKMSGPSRFGQRNRLY